MKNLYLLLFLLPISLGAFADQVDKAAELIKSGNTAELAKMFDSSVDVTVMGEENMLSVSQTQAALESFFKRNPVKSVQILHRINSNPNMRYAVLLAASSSSVYRISISMKLSKGEFLINEIRIEPEKK